MKYFDIFQRVLLLSAGILCFVFGSLGVRLIIKESFFESILLSFTGIFALYVFVALIYKDLEESQNKSG